MQQQKDRKFKKSMFNTFFYLKKVYSGENYYRKKDMDKKMYKKYSYRETDRTTERQIIIKNPCSILVSV
jgi:hypothetical protein